MMPHPPVIETHQLTKRFGQFAAVDALDLAVRADHITGFLGRNGAGKSTTKHDAPNERNGYAAGSADRRSERES